MSIFNEDVVLASLIQDSERCVCVVVFLFCEMQEKRKIPVFSNGSALSSGAMPRRRQRTTRGPELQRTGRVGTDARAGVSRG